MLLQAEERDRYCCDTASTSAMTISVSSTFLVTSAASFFKFSSVVMMVSSSRMRPLTSLRACSKDFSSWRRRSWNSPKRDERRVSDRHNHHVAQLLSLSVFAFQARSVDFLVIVFVCTPLPVSPCSFRRSDRFSSTSGLSAFRTSLRHWLWRLLRVTVKLTNVTREHRSGGNSTCI